MQLCGSLSILWHCLSLGLESLTIILVCFCFLKIFWSYFTACGILDSITRYQNCIPCIPALVEQILNHGPAGKSPIILVLMKQYITWNWEGQMHWQRFYVMSKLKPSTVRGNLNRNLEERRQTKI